MNSNAKWRSSICPLSPGIDWRHHEADSFFVPYNAAYSLKISDRLAFLNAATAIEDMNKPGYRLHPLKGDLKGFWAVDVSGNCRIVFKFEDGDAYIVNYEDYH